MTVCIVGSSGKLGRTMVQHALDRGYAAVGVCRAQSVEKLAPFEGRITVIPGATDDREVIRRAVEGCDGVLGVLVPLGGAPLRDGHRPGDPRPRATGCAPRVLVWVAHHA